jgi:glutamate--cysteine ligase
VDTNLYPGGWNNLTPEMMPLAVQAAQAAVEKICPEAKNLLVIPQNRSQNSFYLSNICTLAQIFHMAGLNVRIGSIDPAIRKSTTLDLPDGNQVTLEPVIRGKRRLGVKNFDPCTILLNNDLSTGLPGILEDIHEQFLLPPLHAGWTVRRRSKHFQCYEEVSKRFGKLLGIDPWLINPMHVKCEDADIQTPKGIDRLAANVDQLLAKVRRKYKEYGIGERPFAVIKTDNGTEGQGILTLRDAKDLTAALANKGAGRIHLNAEGGTPELIVQEGVLTNERINDAVAEPVVYMMDRYVVGGFYRIHAERGIDENLNAPGSSFVPLAFSGSAHLPQPGARPGASAPNRFYMYGVIARLAMLSASYELEATDPQAEVFS